MTELSLVHLPREIQCRIACFLPPNDVTQLSFTCKSLCASVAVATLLTRSFPYHMKEGMWKDGAYIADSFSCRRIIHRPFHRIPILHEKRVHSVTVTFGVSRCHSHQHLNRKPVAVKLSIIGKPPSNQTSSKRVTHAAESSARIILTFKRHFRQDYEQYDATFSPAPEEELDYYAVYELEGDLDRRDNYISIYVSKVDTIIFDDAHRNFKKSISLLVSCGVLHKGNPGTRIGEPIRSLVKAVLILSKQIRTSLRTGDAPGQDFLGFFDDFGFPVDDQSLSVLEEVIQAEMDEKQRLLEERNGAGQEEEDKFFRWLLECQPDPDPEPETRTTVFVFRSGGLIETALV